MTITPMAPPVPTVPVDSGGATTTGGNGADMFSVLIAAQLGQLGAAAADPAADPADTATDPAIDTATDPATDTATDPATDTGGSGATVLGAKDGTAPSGGGADVSDESLPEVIATPGLQPAPAIASPALAAAAVAAGPVPAPVPSPLVPETATAASTATAPTTGGNEEAEAGLVTAPPAGTSRGRSAQAPGHTGELPAHAAAAAQAHAQPAGKHAPLAPGPVPVTDAETGPSQRTVPLDPPSDASSLDLGDRAPAPAPVTSAVPVTTAATSPVVGVDPAPATVAAAPGNPVLDQVTPVLTRMVSGPEGQHRMTLRLHPADLGEIHLTVTVKGGSVDVTVSARPEARAMLAEGSSQLRQLLDSVGRTADRIVFRDLPGTGSGVQIITTNAGAGSDAHSGSSYGDPGQAGSGADRHGHDPNSRSGRSDHPETGPSRRRPPPDQRPRDNPDQPRPRTRPWRPRREDVAPMSVSAIESLGTATSATPTGKSSSTQMDKDLFLKLMVAQLRNQDPMNPQDSAEFLAQTAQFTSLEKLEAVAEQSSQALAAQMAFGASTLAGRAVTYLGDDGLSEISGKVDSVRFGAAGPMLSIGGKDVPIANVVTVAT